MNSLRDKNGFAQLRCLPVSGGKQPAAFLYVVKIQGSWQETNHSFVVWAVGERNAQAPLQVGAK